MYVSGFCNTNPSYKTVSFTNIRKLLLVKFSTCTHARKRTFLITHTQLGTNNRRLQTSVSFVGNDKHATPSERETDSVGKSESISARRIVGVRVSKCRRVTEDKN